MSPELYIWYETAPEARHAVRDAFEALVRSVTRSSDQWIGVASAPRLLRRADRVVRADQLRDTWMEVWALPPEMTQQAFIERLQSAATQAGFSRLLRGERHLEVFEPQD